MAALVPLSSCIQLCRTDAEEVAPAEAETFAGEYRAALSRARGRRMAVGAMVLVVDCELADWSVHLLEEGLAKIDTPDSSSTDTTPELRQTPG